jgi:hypothetical protein
LITIKRTPLLCRDEREATVKKLSKMKAETEILENQLTKLEQKWLITITVITCAIMELIYYSKS